MRLVAALLIVICSSGAAIAQGWGWGWATPRAEVKPKRINFETRDIFKSVQCEIGLIAKSKIVQSAKLDRTRVVWVSFSRSTTSGLKGGFSAGFNIPLFGSPNVFAERETLNDGSTTVGGPFNLTTQQTGACFKNRPYVGIYECVIENTEWAQAGTFQCTKVSKAIGKLGASAKANIWFANIGPSAEYNTVRSYTIKVEYPATKSQLAR